NLGGLTRGYAGTFLIFSDYMRPAVRLSALMGVPSIFVWTHDSIGLGEDGPTHQPIEHLAALRAIPNLDIVRPADANEVAVAWKTILSQRQRPSGLVLSRQGLPIFDRSQDAFRSAEDVARGAYILVEATNDDGETVPDVVLIGTGSEVQLAVEARETLQSQGIATRVVSAPSLEWFDAQDDSYRSNVLPEHVLTVSIEAGIEQGWEKYTGSHGHSVSLEHYGASADYQTLFNKSGVTTEALVSKVQSLYNASGLYVTPNKSTQPLQAADVSLWLDVSSRDRIASGDLQELIDTKNITGVTTNPPIFAKALTNGEAYKQQLAELAANGTDVQKAVEATTTDDVRAACDVLARVYEATNGYDG